MNAVNGQTGQRNDPNAILNDCREMNRGIDEIGRSINELRVLYNATTSLTTDDELTRHRAKVDEVQNTTMALYRNLTERMKRIKSNPESGNPRNEKQVGATNRRLRTSINEYQKAEAEHRSRVKEQARRQYLTVKPDATEAELAAVGEDMSGENLFQQAVSKINHNAFLTNLVTATSERSSRQCPEHPSGGARSSQGNSKN
jgi:syntaxin 1B/2/3